MTFLRISDLAPRAFIADESDETGQAVRDLALVNLDRVLWIEAEPAAATLRFQIDRDSWLRIVFPNAGLFERALARLDAAFPEPPA